MENNVTIRSIEPDELAQFMQANERAFHSRFREEDVEQARLIAEPDRYFVALDGDDIVGTAGACSTELTVPGPCTLAAPGITAVAVLPSHRRRGLNTRLMGALLDQAAEREEPLAFLWASEAPIYGRFGYGTASFCIDLEVSTERSSFVAGIDTDGRVRSLPREQALPLMRPVYDRVAATRPGMIAVDDRWWTWLFHEPKRDEDEPLFFAVHEDAEGGPDGYAVYKVKHDWRHAVPRNELRLEHLIASTPQATAALWRFVLDVDLVATVKAFDRPADEEIRWLAAEPRRLQLLTTDALWVRLIDISRSLAGRRYFADGRVVFGIDDAFRPETSGRYELVAESGSGTCIRTDVEPSIACSVAALGAAYLGGSTFRQLARAQQVRELEPGALARADAMFASDPSPWFGFAF